MDELDEMDLDEMDLDDEADEADEFDAGRRRRRKGGARLYSLFGKKVFDFTFLAGSSSTTVVIRRALKLSPFYYYWFGLRIHNRDIQLATSSFSLQFFNTLPHPGDPQEFSATTASVSLSCASTDSPPALKLATTNNLGPYFKVSMVVTQGAGAAPQRLYAELSGVLLARPA